MQNNEQKFLISVAPLTRIALTRDQSFFYIYETKLSVGTLVEVPIGRRLAEGIVTQCSADFPRESNFQLKRVSKVLEKDEFESRVLPFVKMLNSKVSYALSRKHVTNEFEQFINQCVAQVETKEQLKVFKLFFEAVVGFYKGK